MKRSISLVVINVLCSVMLLLAPLAAAAEPTSPAEPEEAAEALPTVTITQVQTGNAALHVARGRIC